MKFSKKTKKLKNFKKLKKPLNARSFAAQNERGVNQRFVEVDEVDQICDEILNGHAQKPLTGKDNLNELFLGDQSLDKT